MSEKIQVIIEITDGDITFVSSTEDIFYKVVNYDKGREEVLKNLNDSFYEPDYVGGIEEVIKDIKDEL